MKTFVSKRGPFTEQPFYSDNDLENICWDELRKQNLLPAIPAPIRIDRFVEKRFGVSAEPRTLDNGILGLTVFGQSGVEGIYVSEALENDRSKTSVRRVRSTIAHETGHGLLHSHLFALTNSQPLFGDVSDSNSPKVLCRQESIDTDRKQYAGEWWEFQANAIME